MSGGTESLCGGADLSQVPCVSLQGQKKHPCGPGTAERLELLALTGTMGCKLSQHLGTGLVVGEGEASFSLAPQSWPLAPEPRFVPL